MKKISFRRDILPLKDKLYRLALRITHDTAEAEDVAEDTMIRAWDRRDDLSGYDSVEAFCHTVARNLAIDRSERMDAQNAELDPDLHAVPDERTPQDEMERTEQHQLVRRLMDNLPPNYRQVLQLREIEEMSYQEIAERMQLTEDQVRVTLHRARQALKKRYFEIQNYGL
jgi:RNA polymerase sigma-70 factor (ECF subfamily)